MELVWNLMLVMSLLVLSIDIFQIVMELLMDVQYLFKKSCGLIILSLSMGILLVCGFKGHSYIN